MKPRILCFAPRSGSGPVADPMALLCAMRLVAAAGYEVKVVQSIKGQDYLAEIAALAKDYDIFAVSVITSGGIQEAIEATRQYVCKNYMGLVVWGGWHSSIMPEQVLRQQTRVDFVVIGQGERTVLELVQRKERPFCECSDIKGLAYIDCWTTDKPRFVRTEPRPLEDLNNFPASPYHLIDMEQNLRKGRYGKRTIRYSSSQGCPHRCGFCVEPQVYQRGWTGLNASRVGLELAQLKQQYKIDSVNFTDSNFFADSQRALDIADRLQYMGLNWGDVNGRTHTLLKYKSKDWDLLYRSGLRCVLIGAESALEEGLKVINKDCQVWETVELCKQANAHRVEVALSMMIGLPYPGLTRNMLADKAEAEFNAVVNLMREVERASDGVQNHLLLFTYTPYPGTALYEQALDLGVKPPTTLEGWASYELCNREAPWIPEHVAKRTEVLTEYVRWLLTGNAVDLARGNPLTFLGAWAAKQVARWRWRHGYFGDGPDYQLFKYALKHL